MKLLSIEGCISYSPMHVIQVSTEEPTSSSFKHFYKPECVATKFSSGVQTHQLAIYVDGWHVYVQCDPKSYLDYNNIDKYFCHKLHGLFCRFGGWPHQPPNRPYCIIMPFANIYPIYLNKVKTLGLTLQQVVQTNPISSVTWIVYKQPPGGNL